MGRMSFNASRRSSCNLNLPRATVSTLTERLLASGYTDVRVLQGPICAVKRFNFTTAVVVGLDDAGYQRRYCYEHREDAVAALSVWGDQEHPPGPWIKCKGAGIDLLNPVFC